MSHLIDFASHGLTQEWNGHWALGDLAWAALRGRRPYLINRLPYQEHLRLGEANGFVVLLEKPSKRFDGLTPGQFASRFRSMSDEDARLHMVLVISQRACLRPGGRVRNHGFDDLGLPRLYVTAGA